MDERKPGSPIRLESKKNVRDLGGYRTKDGRAVCRCRLIRSESLYGLSEGDKRILTEEYCLRRIIDFRTLAETGEKPDPIIEGVEYIHNPILSEAQMGMTHEEKAGGFGLLKFLVELIQGGDNGPEKFMSDLYAELVTDENTVKRYRTFFDLLLQQEEGAILCTARRGRTGPEWEPFLFSGRWAWMRRRSAGTICSRTFI